MSEGVIPDHMPVSYQLSHDVRALLNIASDQEKSSADIVPGQNFQQVQSVRIIGPVIIGERQLLRRAAQPSKDTPEPLTSRRHGLVSGSGGSGGSSTDEIAQH